MNSRCDFIKLQREIRLVYSDDIVMVSKALEQHMHHVCKVLLFVYISKATMKHNMCSLFTDTIDYLSETICPRLLEIAIHTQRMLSKASSSEPVLQNQDHFWAYAASLDSFYLTLRKSCLHYIIVWRILCQIHLHRLTTMNFMLWTHWKTPWYHSLCWNFHILEDI